MKLLMMRTETRGGELIFIVFPMGLWEKAGGVLGKFKFAPALLSQSSSISKPYRKRPIAKALKRTCRVSMLDARTTR